MPGHAYERGFDLQLRPERLEQPLGWQRPSLIFVNSTGDLFHADVPDAVVHQVVDVMCAASWHTFQILTKRAERLERLSRELSWPENVWLGVSVETPLYYGRIRHLQRVQVGTRFLSCEPLLAALPDLPLARHRLGHRRGESGAHARPMQPSWARQVRDQCLAVGVPFFFKQWGAHDAEGRWVGKKQAGRLLDGRAWDEMPPTMIPAESLRVMVPGRAGRPGAGAPWPTR